MLCMWREPMLLHTNKHIHFNPNNVPHPGPGKAVPRKLLLQGGFRVLPIPQLEGLHPDLTSCCKTHPTATMDPQYPMINPHALVLAKREHIKRLIPAKTSAWQSLGTAKLKTGTN